MELVCLSLVPVGSVQMYKNLETSEEGEFQAQSFDRRHHRWPGLVSSSLLAFLNLETVASGPPSNLSKNHIPWSCSSNIVSEKLPWAYHWIWNCGESRILRNSSQYLRSPIAAPPNDRQLRIPQMSTQSSLADAIPNPNALRGRPSQEQINNAAMFVQRTKKDYMTRSKLSVVPLYCARRTYWSHLSLIL